MYTIKIIGYGLTETYKDIERELHEEFYVNAIDRFEESLQKQGIKYPKDHIEFLLNLKCSHFKS